MRRIAIAISGKPGSGKTTYAKFIAKSYGLRYVSSGMLFRRIAEERGTSLKELHRLAESDSTIDMLVDRRAVEEARKGGVVIEGHLAAWVLAGEADLKIVLSAPIEVRAKRVASRDNITYEEALEDVKFRERSNADRARRYYGLDINDLSVADLVVSTAKLDVEGVRRVVRAFVEEYRRLHPDLF